LLKIEKIIEDVIKAISNNSSPTLVVPNNRTWKNMQYVTMTNSFLGEVL